MGVRPASLPPQTPVRKDEGRSFSLGSRGKKHNHLAGFGIGHHVFHSDYCEGSMSSMTQVFPKRIENFPGRMHVLFLKLRIYN